MQNDCAELKIRAERKAGEFLRETKRHKGGRPPSSENRLHDATSLSDLGTGKKQGQRWQKIASVPEEKFEEHIRDTKESDLQDSWRKA